MLWLGFLLLLPVIYYYYPVLQKFLVTDTFELIGTKAARITFIKNGQKHQIYLPYNRLRVSRLINYKAEVDGLDVTQRSGLPYLFSASDLGGSQITFVDDEGETKIYKDGAVPGFLL